MFIRFVLEMGWVGLDERNMINIITKIYLEKINYIYKK